jgi:hypothetical protein
MSERWRMPLLLALLIVFGLLAALLGTGIWHVLSWLALSTPLIVLYRKIWRASSKSRHHF